MPDGRFVVEMPFSCDIKDLDFPESKEVALQRFHSLEARFRKNATLKEDCVKFMKEYLNLGHMIKATRSGKYFIPYFCVFNPKSPTTPTRVVFDASAKKSHRSLNDVLLPGAKLQNDVPDVLLPFRIHKLVFCCDISKMYRQTLVADEHCLFMHIFFRENPEDPLEEYELRTITYGLSPSSFLAHRVIRQLAQDEGAKFPLACDVIFHSSVVDDYLVGADSLEELLEIKYQLCTLLSAGKFSLNKWLSNSPDFISSLLGSDTSGSLVVRNSDDNNIKVLGLGWDPKSDEFFFTLDPPPIDSVYTKRRVLSAIAKIYDPLGFTAPTIFLLKCLLKDVWLSGVGWDDPLPPSLSAQWHLCLTELPSLSRLRIPRCLFPSPPASCHLIGFCDGSLKGSAAALYLRIQYVDQSVKMFLLKAKTKVAPSKTPTIPRLELAGALLLSQLVHSVQSFMNHLPLSCFTTLLVSDSTIVLSWINKPPHLLKLFVSNRVTAILEHTNASQWCHVASEDNISDVASRGLSPEALVSFSAWFNGPSWALKPPEYWPLNKIECLPLASLPEVKLDNTSVLATNTVQPSEVVPYWLYKYSNFSKLLRVTSFIFRFIFNARNPKSRVLGSLSTKELDTAFKFCIRSDQQINFSAEHKCLSSNRPCSSKVLSLSPFLDEAGLIRVGGRLVNSELSFERKHPILLYNYSPLTRLIILQYHLTYLHVGPRTLQSVLTQKFWIINCRSVVRQVVRSCVVCARFKGETVSPPMGDLPSTRVTPSRAFLHCGVDLAGPYTLKESLRRNARTYKAYFALFICFAVKAVHIEVLTSLSADSFIAALHRFTARRGVPASIYSDQATNFKGGARKLNEVSDFLKSANKNPLVQNYFVNNRIKFLFNVPHAPFMAGLAESNIKNIKYHLLRVVGNQVLTFEEFSTVTTRAEAIVNSRPLCPESSSPDDLRCLTPSHFLIGDLLTTLPEEGLVDVPMNRLSRWELVSQISQSLWHRWEGEYLQTLQVKSKWFDPSVNIQLGQLVWLKEDGSPPLSYPLGRIIDIHPGQDKVVRAVTVRTQAGTYKRPVRKVAPLPIA